MDNILTREDVVQIVLPHDLLFSKYMTHLSSGMCHYQPKQLETSLAVLALRPLNTAKKNVVCLSCRPHHMSRSSVCLFVCPTLAHKSRKSKYLR